MVKYWLGCSRCLKYFPSFAGIGICQFHAGCYVVNGCFVRQVGTRTGVRSAGKVSQPADSTRITRGRTRARAITASTAARATSPSKAVENTCKRNTQSRNVTEKYTRVNSIKKLLSVNTAATIRFVILLSILIIYNTYYP